MKKTIYSFTLVFMLFATTLYGQSCEDWGYTLTFENTFEPNCLNIDTISNSNNIWQIGSPQKTLFTSSYSTPNAIVTDLNNSYPANDTSIFIIKNIAVGGGFQWPHTVILAGRYFVNSDTLTDYGIIEFSPDNGTTWIDLLNDTVIIDSINYWYWIWWDNSDKPTLTGNSDGWKSFYVNLAEVGYAFGVNYHDTVLYRFTFISDSIQTGKDGLMFDDLHFEDWVEGIDEIAANEVSIYPNPASSFITVVSPEARGSGSKYEVKIFNAQGQLVTLSVVEGLQSTIINQKSTIDISALSKGIYFLSLDNGEGQVNGKFVKQ